MVRAFSSRMSLPPPTLVTSSYLSLLIVFPTAQYDFHVRRCASRLPKRFFTQIRPTTQLHPSLLCSRV
ncbi:hypothetical protein EXIGLDRAFT_737048, partial [Exidia glandulosa HHB12029]